MKRKTLYKPPPDPIFPFVDFYYKDKLKEDMPDDALITLSTSTQNEEEGDSQSVSVVVPNELFSGNKHLFLRSVLLRSVN